MPNKKVSVQRAGKVPGHTSVEGKVESVALDEIVVDPNDPRAVQTPESLVGSSNSLDVYLEPTPNEVFGDEPEAQINPHTGEKVDEATTPSPVPSNVEAVESVDDVLTADDVTGIEDDGSESPEPEPDVVIEPSEPAPEPTPEPSPEPEPSE